VVKRGLADQTGWVIGMQILVILVCRSR
jgi:hypothetical protein